MKSSVKILAILLLVTIGTFGFVASSSAGKGDAVTETDSLASAYGTHCARCHGGDGKANTAKGRELDADDLTTAKVQNMSTAKLTNIIKRGKGDMPGFPKLSQAQITQIIRTVKSF